MKVAGDRLVQVKVIFKESLTKSLNREAVATQSPGLTGFDGNPGNRTEKWSSPNGVAPNLTLHKQPVKRNPAQPR